MVGVVDAVVLESVGEAMIGDEAIFLSLHELCHNILHVLCHSDVVEGLLEVLGDLRVSVALSQELGGGEVVTDSLEELGHRDVIVGKVLRDSDIVLSLLEEFGHCYIVLREELCHTDVVLDLIEEFCHCAVKKLVQISIVCRSQILQDVLHVAFAIESV